MQKCHRTLLDVLCTFKKNNNYILYCFVSSQVILANKAKSGCCCEQLEIIKTTLIQ